jgi:hypothetical protein
MVVKNHFTVRSSAKVDGYYIDYLGNYSVIALSENLDIDPALITSIFEKYANQFDTEFGVYYFSSKDKATAAIEVLVSSVPANMRGRAIYLTDKEIELIRKALINEDNNFLTVKSSLKDEIFKKLNQTY